MRTGDGLGTRDIGRRERAIFDTILLVGCGKMGSALLSQWVKGPERFHIVNPSPRDLPEGVAYSSRREELEGTRFDCIIVGVKPQMIDDVMPDYAQHLSAEGYVLSIAAGYEAQRLSETMGGAPVVRTMPNLPSAIGRGVSGLYPAPGTSAEQAAHAEELMQRAGMTVGLDTEVALDRFTTIAGCGPGYVFEFARVYAEAAQEIGFDADEARAMVLETIAGTIAMAMEPDAPDLAELRNSVTSKGGVTAEGLRALNGDDGLADRMRATLEAAYRRAVELR